MSRLLILDDDTVSRLLLQHMVEQCGHSTVTTSNIEQARSHLKQEQFDLVLSDYDLGEARGLDLLSDLPKDMENRPAFVLITGTGEQNDLGDARSFEVDGYLTKPVSSQELKACLENLLTAEQTG